MFYPIFSPRDRRVHTPSGPLKLLDKIKRKLTLEQGMFENVKK